MKCLRCKDAKALKHSDMCGICEIIDAKGQPAMDIR